MYLFSRRKGSKMSNNFLRKSSIDLRHEDRTEEHKFDALLQDLRPQLRVFDPNGVEKEEEPHYQTPEAQNNLKDALKLVSPNKKIALIKYFQPYPVPFSYRKQSKPSVYRSLNDSGHYLSNRDNPFDDDTVSIPMISKKAIADV